MLLNKTMHSNQLAASMAGTGAVIESVYSHYIIAGPAGRELLRQVECLASQCYRMRLAKAAVAKHTC